MASALNGRTPSRAMKALHDAAGAVDRSLTNVELTSVPRDRRLGSGERRLDAHKAAFEDGTLEKSMTAQQTNQGWITRKKLPWLDGPQSSKPGEVPGAWQSSLELATAPADADVTVPGFVAVAPSPSKREKARASISSVGGHPSLRAIGSSASLRNRPKSVQRPRTLSLNSDPRPGVRAAVSTKHQAKRALGIVSEQSTRIEDYTPSEYSTTISSDADHAPMTELEPMPSTLPKRDPSSYERLVQQPSAKVQRGRPKRGISPQKVDRALDFPFNEVAPLSMKRKCEDDCSSCRHCDSPILERKQSELRSPLKTAMSPSGRSDMPPYLPPKKQTTMPKPIVKRETLHALPSHLMAPSSSTSSSLPSHLRVTSPDISSPPSRTNTKLPPPTKRERHDDQPSPKEILQGPAPAVIKHRNLRRENRSLNSAVTGLEDLLEQALDVARDAASSGRKDEVAQILSSATAALRQASNALPMDQSLGRSMTDYRARIEPYPRGDDASSSGSETPTNPSTLHTRADSAGTAPTIFTRSAKSSAQPLVSEKYRKDGKSLTSLRAARVSSSSEPSMTNTPPRLYQPASADSIVRDFAYAGRRLTRAQARSLDLRATYGAAADFYGDHGESVAAQPGVRRSVVVERVLEKPKPKRKRGRVGEGAKDGFEVRPAPLPLKDRSATGSDLTPLPQARMDAVPSRMMEARDAKGATLPQRSRKAVADGLFEPAYFRVPDASHPAAQVSTLTNTRAAPPTTDSQTTPPANLKLSPRRHISLKGGQGFSLGRYHRRQPIAREWHTLRKRITAAVACANTVFIGLIAGIYAGEVPRIQYQIQDLNHEVILGNVLLFLGLGLSTLIFWPLPLLHGRKPYTLLAFACMLPLQFPQALVVAGFRDPNNSLYRCGLLIPRAFTGFALGFANVNQLPTLFDLFGCSLMSEAPHQEIVMQDDVRRQGGGVGIWLGLWSFCFVGSLSIGFCIGACIISGLDPSWGFYIVVIMLAVVLLVNVIAPETRRAPYRRSIAHFIDNDENLRRRVARGEVKLHISNEGPRWWWQEVLAGVILSTRMTLQPGFFVLAWYIAWIYAQVTLVILKPQYVGLATLSLALGAILAIPLAKASIFSRARYKPQRTDSMTMRSPRFTWSSHLIRRCTFTLLLPFAALGYTLTAPGPSINWSGPTIFAALIGFLSNLAVAETVGLIMETFDTCDLQPGSNQKHRLQSMAETTRRRRTNYSSFPRVCAGFFAAQSLGFFLAAVATAVSGELTRALGAQIAISTVAAILLVITVLFILVMVRWKEVQVIPNSVFERATKKGSVAWGADDPEWRPVIIGNPSGKMRRVNLLELGSQSRWTELRQLNKLIKE
ncbi:hypothetical protein BAUCODRAFT_146258 [Baudoinia panamericana UAMH 10762]|uniref:Uncharacterized protein n=1 Tax=Baudoinia panamericana (strain UAMH 10762) TaxID=717646 RepID=M2LX77_BAUPA|nr:uncharacterized protein BAUCODRAFT_146258 [Baudoinia panamericana UAMH 10762]EMC99297.1 hypothetical protein BAUCODRAFT_146258 [Baudoinia panamericana UAMH 10762]